MDDSLNQGPAAAPRAGVLVFEPRAGVLRAAAWARARAAGLICAALLGAMSLQMLAVIKRKSITNDEFVLIPAAYYHLAAGDCQLTHEHPPFAKLLAAVPLLFLQPEEARPESLGVAPDSPAGKWRRGERFWGDNTALLDSISFWARVPLIALSVATGLLLFAFTRELFGPGSAALAVALYAFEPTVLAHGRVVQTDMAAAFGYLLTAYALLRYLKLSTPPRALLLGAAGGVACLAKFSMLLVAPVLGVVFAVLWWRAPRSGAARKSLAAHAGLVALAAVLVINAAYFFDHRPLGPDGVGWIREKAPASPTAVARAVEAARYVLPTDFVLGALWQFWHNREGHNAALLGMYGRFGWWHYFPVAFALKTTLPFLLVSLAALAWASHGLLRRRERRFLLPVAAFAVYNVFVMFSRIDIGVRYYLPAYLPLFVLGGALLVRMWEARHRHRVWAPTVVILLGWTLAEAVRAYPDHIPYMNQLASARPHWWYLSDSNVEWGDDIKELSEYLKARGETQVRTAVVGAWGTLNLYGVGNLDLTEPPGVVARYPPTRYTAVGASYLNGSTVPEYTVGTAATIEERVNKFASYRERRPEAVFGRSIYLFREDGQ
jgi:4-amino-4-deoxy-L-arabinose transferase-like glycosyltransferase